MEVTAPAVQSLVEQVRRLSPPVEQPMEPVEAADGTQGGRILADGYCRLSPVQAYVLRRNGKRRRLLTALAIAGGVAALAVLLYLLIHFLIFRQFRLFA